MMRGVALNIIDQSQREIRKTKTLGLVNLFYTGFFLQWIVCLFTLLRLRMGHQHVFFYIFVTLTPSSIHSYTDMCDVLRSCGHTSKNPTKQQHV